MLRSVVRFVVVVVVSGDLSVSAHVVRRVGAVRSRPPLRRARCRGLVRILDAITDVREQRQTTRLRSLAHTHVPAERYRRLTEALAVSGDRPRTTPGLATRSSATSGHAPSPADTERAGAGDLGAACGPLGVAPRTLAAPLDRGRRHRVREVRAGVPEQLAAHAPAAGRGRGRRRRRPKGRVVGAAPAAEEGAVAG